MFAIPLFGLKGLGHRVPIWLKAAAASGFAMTLLFVSLSIMPIVKVESQLLFAVKIGGLIVVTNLIGLGIYFAARRRTRG